MARKSKYVEHAVAIILTIITAAATIIVALINTGKTDKPDAPQKDKLIITAPDTASKEPICECLIAAYNNYEHNFDELKGMPLSKSDISETYTLKPNYACLDATITYDSIKSPGRYIRFKIRLLKTNNPNDLFEPFKKYKTILKNCLTDFSPFDSLSNTDPEHFDMFFSIIKNSERSFKRNYKEFVLWAGGPSDSTKSYALTISIKKKLPE